MIATIIEWLKRRFSPQPPTLGEQLDRLLAHLAFWGARPTSVSIGYTDVVPIRIGVGFKCLDPHILWDWFYDTQVFPFLVYRFDISSYLSGHVVVYTKEGEEIFYDATRVHRPENPTAY